MLTTVKTGTTQCWFIITVNRVIHINSVLSDVDTELSLIVEVDLEKPENLSQSIRISLVFMYPDDDDDDDDDDNYADDDNIIHRKMCHDAKA